MRKQRNRQSRRGQKLSEYQYNADAFEARGVDEVKQEAAHKEVLKVRADKAR